MSYYCDTGLMSLLVDHALPAAPAARGYQGLRMREQDYFVSHGEVLLPGINDGLAYVFGGN